jgi:hypothetical protein
MHPVKPIDGDAQGATPRTVNIVEFDEGSKMNIIKGRAESLPRTKVGAIINMLHH